MLEREIKLETPLLCPTCGKNAHVYMRGQRYYAECFPCLFRTTQVDNTNELASRWLTLTQPEICEKIVANYKEVKTKVSDLRRKYS